MTTLTLSAWRSLVRRDADYLAQTEAGSFAILPGTQLSEEEAAEVDRQYHAKKVSGGLRVRDDAFAKLADLQWLDAMRRAGL
jgi:hypothetical protein